MTIKKQTIRLVFIVATLLAVFFGGRELYYARSVNQNSIQIKLDGIDLAKISTGVIIGTVEKSLGTERFIDETGEVMVNTRWQIKVDKIYKGSLPEKIVVQISGGRHGLTEVIVEDAPNLIKGEKVLLYLESSRNPEEYQITGQFQGKFTMSKDESGTEIFVETEGNIKKTVTELENELRPF